MEALKLLEKEPFKIPAEINNNGEIFAFWQANLDTFKAYKMAGIQMWRHTAYEAYKCHGPYVKNWGCCSASWHPSLLGHELRAAHHSYFWLLIYRDALRELLNQNTNDLKGTLQVVQKHVDSEHRHIPVQPMYESHFTDTQQCLTAFEPRFDPESDILKFVVSKDEGDKKAFKHDIIEDMFHPGTTKKFRARGYLDYKVGQSGVSELNIVCMYICIYEACMYILIHHRCEASH
jgi:hypothetical protein